MEVAWVLSEDYADPIVKPEQLKEVGTSWGSWKTWRSWSTDNVLCADNAKAQDLIKRAFHSVCNFYIHNKNYIALNRPTGVKVFDGDFPDDFANKKMLLQCIYAVKVNWYCYWVLIYKKSQKKIQQPSS